MSVNPYVINTSVPQGRNLAAFWKPTTGNLFTEYITRNHAVPVNNAFVNALGLSTYGPNDGARGATADFKRNYLGQGGYACLSVICTPGVYSAGTGNIFVFELCLTGGTSAAMILTVGVGTDANCFRWTCIQEGGGSTAYKTNPVVLPNNRICGLFECTNGVATRMWVNGQPQPLVSITPVGIGSATKLTLGNRSGFNRNFPGVISDVRIYLNEGSDALAADIWDDPTKIFTPRRPLYFQVADVPLVFPTEDQVLDGVQYGPVTGTEFTGNVLLPVAGDVRDGTAFGPNGNGTGTLALPSIDDVRLDVQFGTNGTEFNGDVNIPPPENVTIGTHYNNANSTPGVCRVPLEVQVLASTVFGPSDTLTGVIYLPGDSDVKANVTFGANGANTGTYNPSPSTGGGGVGDYMVGKILQQASIADLSAAVALSSVLTANTNADSVYLQAFAQDVFVTVDGTTPTTDDTKVIAGGPPQLVQGLTPMTAAALALIKAKQTTATATASVFLVQSPRSMREP